jgi:hypothetical protein
MCEFAIGFYYEWPSHSQPHWQRIESLNLSFFRSALHTAHDLIHMFSLLQLPQ